MDMTAFFREHFRELFRRALVSAGEPERLRVFRSKLERRIPITYGAIGGSITAGAKAEPGKAYVPLLHKKIQQFTACRLVNAGIGATGSLFGAFRAADDLLQYRPDLITIEFAVNDKENPEVPLTFEALVRRCLAQPDFPLIVLVFTSNEAGKNVQHLHIPIGKYYHLPMLSYRDAVWPEIEKGLFAWRDISPDEVHPNDAGHGLIANLLAEYILNSLLPGMALPPPLNRDCARFEAGECLRPAQWKILRNTGWAPFPEPAEAPSFFAETPGAELVLEVNARQLIAGYARYAGDFGMADVWIDGRKICTLDGFFELPRPDMEWKGNHTVFAPLMEEAEAKVRQVHLVLAEACHPGSHGHLFKLRCLLRN